MSFCCFLRNENGVVLCSDSREIFGDGSYNENKQKLFITESQKYIYGCTGVIKWQNKDYLCAVEQIMNMESTLLNDKLISISQLMQRVTQDIYFKNREDSRFDMFLVDSKSLNLYVLSVKNGKLIDDSIIKEYPVIHTMGKQVDLFHYYTINEYEKDDVDKLLEKGKFLVHKAALRESVEEFPTINGNIQWISIDRQGYIKSKIYKNSKNKNI